MRLWLGWEWLRAGWTKVFGGNIIWRPWDWTKSAYSLTGDGNLDDPLELRLALGAGREATMGR